MKTLIISLAILALAGAASAQLSEVSFSCEGMIDKLLFIEPGGSNINYFLLEDHDSLHADIPGPIDSRSVDVESMPEPTAIPDVAVGCQHSPCVSAQEPIVPAKPPPVKHRDAIISSATCTAISKVCTR